MSTSVPTYRYQRERDSESSSPAPGVVPEIGVQEEEFSNLEFRRTMGRFATGVTVVSMLAQDGTAALPGDPAPERAFGITVNGFMSVSLEPALIAISIDKSAHAHATLVGAKRFAISVLAEEQRDLSDHFAGRRVDPEVEPFVSFAGFPVIAGAVAHIVCRSYQAFDAGDHTIFLGEVLALRQAAGRPLIFHGGRYERLGMSTTT